MKEKIIIDTDPGVDDALALIMLEKTDLFDIRAVTTVAGNSTIQNVTNNAAYILELAESKAPLFSDAAKPLKKKLFTAKSHGKKGLDGIKNIKHVPLTGDAPERIVEIIKKYPNQITIVAIGPLTNIATAFLLDPEIPKLIKKLIIMGGGIDIGNVTKSAEFNFFVDPEATRVVFESNVPKVLITLNVCYKTPVVVEDFEKLKDSKLYDPILSMIRPYKKGLEKYEGNEMRGIVLYDVLAAYYLVNPGAFCILKANMNITKEGQVKLTVDNADYNTEIVQDVVKEDFIKDFFDWLGC
ncbi:MAG: Inosine-uridine nucleoside N-ribohydrolase [candidate division CPR2 bacterium GW2011_GWC1_39_9]|uniref:Inosine-uridine nucleoside N-ribohydrolase n=1 Tax=candidate division CPR2 bacterium GW2011_GWC2_39_10 TaxID=1618345 RepID=A0A0G0LLY1_UNCC2|nr:MAG: Inosine-uridine nucleoside N-ribohydrolase [candidate division CPR2 bacterium GW2011_GWC2_39_10]KKR35186.1 MAG: Inosine-uridine nucleoside N-ribohydrolase [candidate division CPR2 bacterium GW2011_GWC1_39_9]